MDYLKIWRFGIHALHAFCHWTFGMLGFAAKAVIQWALEK
jgi:hypothetical protein